MNCFKNIIIILTTNYFREKLVLDTNIIHFQTYYTGCLKVWNRYVYLCVYHKTVYDLKANYGTFFILFCVVVNLCFFT